MNRIVIIILFFAQLSFAQDIKKDMQNFKDILSANPCTFQVDMYTEYGTNSTNSSFNYIKDRDKVKVWSDEILYVFDGEIGILVYHPDKTVMVKHIDQKENSIEVDISKLDLSSLTQNTDMESSIYEAYVFSESEKFKVYTLNDPKSKGVKSSTIKFDKQNGMPILIESEINTSQRQGYPRKMSYKLKKYKSVASIPASEFSIDDILSYKSMSSMKLIKKYSNYTLIGS